VGQLGLQSTRTVDLPTIQKYVHRLAILAVFCITLRVLWVFDVVSQVESAIKDPTGKGPTFPGSGTGGPGSGGSGTGSGGPSTPGSGVPGTGTGSGTGTDGSGDGMADDNVVMTFTIQVRYGLLIGDRAVDSP
jgi:hypothetical protein